jgi:PIN domain nuclease of toxin-antitoxin system
VKQLLLDTHAFLWWVNDAPELSTKARKAIADEASTCFLSLASCWEMAIKSSLGKLGLAMPLDRFIPEQLAANGFSLLNIDFRHAARVESLPFLHRDPFDRLLVAQALAEKLTLVSADAMLSDYGVKRIW